MSDKYDWEQEDKAAMADMLLSAAGLSRSDFHGVLKVEESLFTGRIVVTARPSLEAHPAESRDNLVVALHTDSYSEFTFNRVPSEVEE